MSYDLKFSLVTTVIVLALIVAAESSLPLSFPDCYACGKNLLPIC